MNTSNSVVVSHKCTCSENRMLEAASSGFWNTPAGILHSIDGLSQDLMFKTVNNALKMVAPTNHISWMHWNDVEDSRECNICLRYGQGGNGSGYYKVSWFMPQSPPVHQNCRCTWELVFGEI